MRIETGKVILFVDFFIGFDFSKGRPSLSIGLDSINVFPAVIQLFLQPEIGGQANMKSGDNLYG